MDLAKQKFPRLPKQHSRASPAGNIEIKICLRVPFSGLATSRKSRIWNFDHSKILQLYRVVDTRTVDKNHTWKFPKNTGKYLNASMYECSRKNVPASPRTTSHRSDSALPLPNPTPELTPSSPVCPLELHSGRQLVIFCDSFPFLFCRKLCIRQRRRRLP